MSQINGTRALDERIMLVTQRAQAADLGRYAPQGIALPSATNCRVYVNRDVQGVGEFGQVTESRTEITFLLADLTPAQNGLIAVGSETWKLMQRAAGSDESRSVWVAQKA